MAATGPTPENNPGHYTTEEMSVIRPDGTELLALGDSISPTNEDFLGLSADETVVVAAFDTDAGDVLMIELVGPADAERIDAESLDRLLDGKLTIS
jgi:hypothetical protein